MHATKEFMRAMGLSSGTSSALRKEACSCMQQKLQQYLAVAVGWGCKDGRTQDRRTDSAPKGTVHYDFGLLDGASYALCLQLGRCPVLGFYRVCSEKQVDETFRICFAGTALDKGMSGC
jgi:hypothetical protein